MRLRTYSINNWYVAGIRAGIQSAHSHDELTVKYLHPLIQGESNLSEAHLNKAKLLMQCQKIDKTAIILNGGENKDLKNFLFFLEQNDYLLDYPFAEFFESEDALNGALTSISIVLPETIFDYSRIVPAMISKLDFSKEESYTENGITIKEEKEYVYTIINSNKDENIEFKLYEKDIELMNLIGRMPLMS